MTVERTILPFTCEQCGARFHELDGFICTSCKRLLCRTHLVDTRATILCLQCVKPRGDAAA